MKIFIRYDHTDHTPLADGLFDTLPEAGHRPRKDGRYKGSCLRIRFPEKRKPRKAAGQECIRHIGIPLPDAPGHRNIPPPIIDGPDELEEQAYEKMEYPVAMPAPWGIGRIHLLLLLPLSHGNVCDHLFRHEHHGLHRTHRMAVGIYLHGNVISSQKKQQRLLIIRS